MRRMVLLIALAGTAVTVASSAAQERACTQIGCSSGLSVRLTDDAGRVVVPRSARLTVCMDDACRRFRAEGEFVYFAAPAQQSEGPVRVRIVLRSRRGRLLLRHDRMTTLRRLQPNGPECEPVCWQAGYRILSGYRLRRTR